MSPGKVMTDGIVLQEQGLEMCQGVLLAKESPHPFFRNRTAIVKLLGFELCKLFY